VNSLSRSADARSPLVFDVHEMSRQAGTMKEISRSVPAPADLGIEMMRVPEGSPIALELRLQSVVEGIWVSGTADVELAGECSRCLTYLEDEASFDLEELFVHPDREADEDATFVVDERIDLEPALRDAVVLDLPFTPLCREDCAGLCTICGANLNDDPEHTHGEQVDPRWSNLLRVDTDDN
jgi:uncharacterized protein